MEVDKNIERATVYSIYTRTGYLCHIKAIKCFVTHGVVYFLYSTA